jgi:hypothetical protein
VSILVGGELAALERTPGRLLSHRLLHGRDSLAPRLRPMISEPFGNLADAKISVAYRNELRRFGTQTYQVPYLVLLEYPNGLLRLLRQSEIDAFFERLVYEGC